MSRRAYLFFYLLALSLLWSATAGAAHPGFRTIGIWHDEDRLRLDLCVWYPVQSTPSPVRYGNWLLKVNRRAAPLQGSWPLLVISHASEGNRFAHHELAAALSALGYIVVAPTHQEDNTQNMSHLHTARQLTHRLHELRHTIDRICADPAISPFIDTNRIGVIGFGAGGTAAVLAAGGRISPAAWDAWKKTAPENAPYLYPWARARLDALAVEPVLGTLQANNRIRSVIAVAPAHSMFFDTASLARLRVPVMLVAAEKDQLNPGPDPLAALHKSLPTPGPLVTLHDVDPLALMSLPEGRHMDFLPGYAPPPAKTRAQASTQLYQELVRFLAQNIGNPQLPPPPPPLPDDTVIKAEPPKPAPLPPEKQKKKRR